MQHLLLDSYIHGKKSFVEATKSLARYRYENKNDVKKVDLYSKRCK